MCSCVYWCWVCVDWWWIFCCGVGIWLDFWLWWCVWDVWCWCGWLLLWVMLIYWNWLFWCIEWDCGVFCRFFWVWVVVLVYECLGCVLGWYVWLGWWCCVVGRCCNESGLDLVLSRWCWDWGFFWNVVFVGCLLLRRLFVWCFFVLDVLVCLVDVVCCWCVGLVSCWFWGVYWKFCFWLWFWGCCWCLWCFFLWRFEFEEMGIRECLVLEDYYWLFN